jgi:hypothetical protein
MSYYISLMGYDIPLMGYLISILWVNNDALTGYYHLSSAPAIDTGDDNLEAVPLALGRDQRLAAHMFATAKPRTIRII